MLVSGTCIGAGMLGLPIATAASGYYPSVLSFLVCWGMMLLSAYYMLEVSLWHKEETNLISMAKETLGKGGEWIAWGCYVLFLYALMTAYTSVASGIVESFLARIHLEHIPSLWVMILLFGTLVYLGTTWVDWANRLLMVGLVTAYMALVLITLPKVEAEQLGLGSPQYLWTIWPILVTSFGFHLLIPSLKNYMKGDVNGLRCAIFLGSLLSLCVYLLWETLIIGVVPVEGDNGLIAMLKAPQPVDKLLQALSDTLQNHAITILARIFSLFAILTSFMGVALGMFDFFADGFHISKTMKGKFILALCTFFPPAFFAATYPSAFLMALRYAGIFAAILLIIYPALMVWYGRYHSKIAHGYRVAGGRGLVILTCLFGIGVIILEILINLKHIPSP
jgi:tyrosine-specific transport protein